MTEADPLPYEENRGVVARQDQLAGWDIEFDPDSGLLATAGPCPACGHPTATEIRKDAPPGAAAATTASPPERRATRRFSCLCGEGHPGRPPAVSSGCGRWWLAAVERRDDGTWHLSADVGLLASQAALELHRAATTDLASARTTAEKWLPGLAGLYGLFAISGAVVGRDVVKDLAPAGRWILVAVLALGVTLAGVSILSGYRAAYGWLRPDQADVSTDDKLLTWYTTQRRNTIITSASSLRTAVIAACAALALLVVALAVVWVGPARKPAAATVKVAYREGGDPATTASACGTLATGGPAQVVRVKVADGAVTRTVSIPAAWIDRIETVNTCA
jgi:hypothetical protein